jgi:UPF0716 family protein affecting phage T7 exclusion
MLVALLIPFLFAELYLSLSVVDEIGAGWSVLWIVGSIFVGIKLLNNSQYAIEGGMMNVAKGKLDIESFQNASMAYLLGSVLLIIPGILSDTFGALALLYTLYLQFVAKVTPEKQNFNQKGDNNVIDVEIID